MRELEKEANKLTTEVDEVDMTGNSLERIIVLPLKRSKANRLIHRASVNYILDENKGEIVKSSTTGKPTMDQLIK